MLNQYVDVYQQRWKNAISAKDDDILCFESPKTQVQFFYLMYNSFIEKRIKKSFENTETLKIIELGCGRATSSIYQAKKLGANITVTDYSEAALEIARRNLKKYNVEANVKQADLYQLPFVDETFDVVISLGVMEHINDPINAYKEMHRILRPNGVVISMNVPERRNIQRIAIPVNKILSKIELFIKNAKSKPWLDADSQFKTANVYRSEADSNEFKGYLQKADFHNCEAVEFNPFPTIGPVPKFSDHILALIYRLTLKFRKSILRMPNPEYSNSSNSRCHFVIGRKS